MRGPILVLFLTMGWEGTVVLPEGIPRTQTQPSTPQSPAGSEERSELRLGTTLVNTFVTVRDKEGRLISTLNATDFSIWDNGSRQRISEFSRETQLPLTLGLVIDRSRSVQQRFELERAAAIHFLESVLRKGQDQGFLMVFDSDLYLVHDLTDDAAVLSEKVRDLSATGNSGIFDAVFKTAQHKFGPIPHGRKVMVLITDGADTASEATLDEAVNMALQCDVIVYPIGINPSKKAISALDRLADMTGGQTLVLNEKHPQLAELFESLQDELRNQYSIGYLLNRPPDGRFHRLKIRAKKRGLKVRARRGYYALSNPVSFPESGGRG